MSTNKELGYSLIEVLIALVVMSVSSLGLLSSIQKMNSSERSIKNGEDVADGQLGSSLMITELSRNMAAAILNGGASACGNPLAAIKAQMAKNAKLKQAFSPKNVNLAPAPGSKVLKELAASDNGTVKGAVSRCGGSPVAAKGTSGLHFCFVSNGSSPSLIEGFIGYVDAASSAQISCQAFVAGAGGFNPGMILITYASYTKSDVYSDQSGVIRIERLTTYAYAE